MLFMIKVWMTIYILVCYSSKVIVFVISVFLSPKTGLQLNKLLMIIFYLLMTWYDIDKWYKMIIYFSKYIFLPHYSIKNCRCVAAKGDGSSECEKFAKYYRSLCPGEWVSSLISIVFSWTIFYGTFTCKVGKI